jgi:hypothetical protein
MFFMYQCLQLPIVLDVTPRILRGQEYDLGRCLLPLLSSLLLFTHPHTSNVFLAFPIKIFRHNLILYLEKCRQFQREAYTYFGVHIE